MTCDHQHNPDPNFNAARIVAESTTAAEGTSADLKAAWAEPPGPPSEGRRAWHGFAQGGV